MSSTNRPAYWPRRAFRVYSLSLAVLYRIYPAAGRTYPGLQCGAHGRDVGTAANIALEVITSIDQVVGHVPSLDMSLRRLSPLHSAWDFGSRPTTPSASPFPLSFQDTSSYTTLVSHSLSSRIP
ncbi:hypothetical protein FB451DRAFT_1416028 [Mycena latifolia]|nr:hypothetical protein FB451DRAFT_1416028 [Mycena latifolia]